MYNDIYGEYHTLNKSQRERFDCAVEYMERGYPVFVTKNKQPLKGTRGFKDATIDIEEFARTFSKNPTGQIAVATGHKFWIVDVDKKPDEGIDGLDSLFNHFDEDLTIDPETHMYQTTPSGGMHFFIELPDDDLPIPSSVGVLNGVDIRGHGGYIVISPSGTMINDEWKQYKLRNGEDENFIPMCKWTTELLRMARERKPSSNEGLITRAVTTGFNQGERDKSIFQLACMLRREGIDIGVAEAFIQSVAEKCDPPFSSTAAINKVQYAYNTAKQDTMEAVKAELLSRPR